MKKKIVENLRRLKKAQQKSKNENEGLILTGGEGENRRRSEIRVKKRIAKEITRKGD